MVVLQPVTYRINYNAEGKDRFKEFYLHKVLRAIDQNVILTKLEPQDHCKKSEVFAPVEQLLSHYSEYPVIVENTLKVIEQCSFE